MIFKRKIEKSEDTQEEILHKLEVLTSISSTLVSNIDIEKVLQDSVNIVVDKLKYYGAVIYTPVENKLYSKTVSQTWYVKVALKFIPMQFDQLNVDLIKDKDNFIVRSFNTKETLESNNLRNFVVPAVNNSLSDLIQKVTATKRIVSLPIIFRGKTLGVTMFTKKQDNSFDRDMQVLKPYVEMLGIAIENASLFKEKADQVNVLQAQNKDLASLFNLSSNIAKSLDPVEVAQIAANALPQDDTMVGAIITNYSEMSNTINVQAVSQNAISNAAKQILGDFSKYVLELSNENARLSPTGRAIIQERPVFTNDIAAAFDPPIPKKFLKPIEKLLGIKSIAVYPVIARGELKGTVGFLLKQHLAEEVNDAQKQLFQTYTSQIAIALENAKLFETSQRIQASLESALKELKEAREKERDMIDIMGHELRTPMSIVRNSLGMMEMHLKQKGKIPEDKQQKYVDTALESAKREINLIETLLSATKADSKGFDLTLEKIDFNDVVNDSVEAFSKQAEKKGLTLTVNKPQMPIYVYADRTRAQEIADNFIGNAVKYTPSGSVTITVEQKGDDAWITIADTGYGISEEDLQKLGHKFFRARQHTNEVSSSEEITNTKVPNQANSPAEEKVAAIIRPGGTGLGLYVSFSLIYIMGGKLIVESTLGQDSIFSFALPIYKDQKLDQDQKQVDGNNLPIRITGNKLTIN